MLVELAVLGLQALVSEHHLLIVLLDLRVAEGPQNCGAFVRGLLDELLGAENLRAKGRGRAVRFAE